ncbi:MAG: TRAP transporter small permease [Verrucomicrobia bacterium]|nr:TRAP transporter small permease [Verrucomicrobiota bacterium]
MRHPTQSGWTRPLVKLLEGMVILAMGLLVLDVSWGVISRDLGALKAWLERSRAITVALIPDGQSPWTEELARVLLIWTSLLGASLAFERRAHLGVDYFVGKFHPHAQPLLRTVSHLLVLAFAGWVLMKGGGTLVTTTLASGQVTPALGMPKWLVYLAVPVAGAFVIVFTLEHLRADLKQPQQEAPR